MSKENPTKRAEPQAKGRLGRIAGVIRGGHGRPAAVTLLGAIIVIHIFFGAEVSRPLGNALFDGYQRWFPRQVDRFPVVIVDIDDASIGTLGRWPWPRTRLARLTAQARRLGALAVGYDIIMPEPDHLSPETILAHREGVSAAVQAELARLPSNDALLIQALRQTPSVVARAALIDSEPPQGQKAYQTAVNVVGPSPVPYLTAYNDHLANIPEIEQAAFGCGYLNDTRDKDGVVRVMPLLIAVNGQLAPSLALELIRTALGANWYSVHGSTAGVESIQLGNARVPVDPDGRIRLYFSPAFADRRVSALAVLNGSLPDDAFAGQVAIIGVTGVGTIDVAATPVAARMDGVEVQAQVIENILDNARLVRPQHAPQLEFAFFLFVAVLLIVFLPRAHPGYGIVAFLGIAVLLVAGSLYAFLANRQLYDPTFPISGNAFVVVVLLTAGFAASRQRRRELNAALAAERLERMRITGELQAAREIQMGMLPDPAAISGLPPHVEFHALLEPANEVGGDLYDAFMIDARRFFFIVGDVAGKGVAASLFMALSKTLCKSTALRQGTPLSALLSAANVEISRDNPGMLFVTAMAGIIDTVNGETQLCCAGHDAPVLIRPGAPLQALKMEAGPPLCVLADYTYPDASLTLQAGDALVLISDGVTEAQDPAENLYGRERIMACLDALEPEQATPENLCHGLYTDVQRFAAGADQSDDITIMAIRFNQPPGGAGET